MNIQFLIWKCLQHLIEGQQQRLSLDAKIFWLDEAKIFNVELVPKVC
jgi:hypothetical protein